MTVQLAMYKAPGNWLNAAIRWWTGSQYSHCELVVRGTCYSSTIRDGGVRAKVMALPSDRWDGRGVFCSEACAKALGRRNATRMSPQGLLDACLDINKNAVFVCKT